jgi:hypothetical protein
MSAYRDQSQKFTFDYKNNFYLLYKKNQFDVASTSPVVLPTQQEAESVKVEINKIESFKSWAKNLFKF